MQKLQLASVARCGKVAASLTFHSPEPSLLFVAAPVYPCAASAALCGRQRLGSRETGCSDLSSLSTELMIARAVLVLSPRVDSRNTRPGLVCAAASTSFSLL